jgi:hypothetical protein
MGRTVITWETEPPQAVAEALEGPLSSWTFEAAAGGARLLRHASGVTLQSVGDPDNGRQPFVAVVNGEPVARGAMVDTERHRMRPV